MNEKIIYLFVNNLMDRLRLTETLHGAGWRVKLLQIEPDQENGLAEKKRLILVDLEAVVAQPALAEKLCEARQQGLIEIAAFYPHIRKDLREWAEKCGIQFIFPRSKFFNRPVERVEEVYQKMQQGK